MICVLAWLVVKYDLCDSIGFWWRCHSFSDFPRHRPSNPIHWLRAEKQFSKGEWG